MLDVLRQPLESGWVTISRAARSADFPARFQLVCAMNPCSCGHFGDGTDRCACSPAQRVRYAARVSGRVIPVLLPERPPDSVLPGLRRRDLLDHLDLLVETLPWSDDIDGAKAMPGETTARVAERVAAARALQDARQGAPSARLTPNETERHCSLGETERTLMHRAARRFGLSARSHHRVLRMARTIADLAGSERIERAHVLEALSYRRLERFRA